MSDRLSKIRAPEGANTKKTRVGRGVGSGLGKTSGRGQKGQKARSTGQAGRLWFEGGQTPLARRLPKRGFRSLFRKVVAAINVGDLENVFEAGADVNEATLRDARLVKGGVDKIKILGEGQLTKKLVVSAHGFSESAKSKIEAVGGSIVLLASEPEEPQAE
jgi:large subunit ribosomal protein L15